MNARKSTAARLFLTGALALTAPGCDEGQDVGMVGGKAYPPIGSEVHVQFRRDFLGFAGEKGSSPVGADPNVVLASSGELRRMTDEFVVIGVANEPTRELWIPREAVLLLDVNRPREPQQE